MRNKQHLINGIIIMIVLAILMKTTTFRGITGFVVYNNATINTSVEIVNWTTTNCSFQLYKGWNLVSFPCISNENLSIALQPIDGSYEAVFTYDNNEWLAYNPNLPSYVIQDLNIIDRKKGYWIEMREDRQYSRSGYMIAYANILLHNGYNLIGYPSNTTRNATDIFNEPVWGYDNANKQWITQYLIPYHGYWVYSNTTHYVRIDWS